MEMGESSSVSIKTKKVGWKAKDYDKEMFLLTSEEIQVYGTEHVMDSIIRACNATIPRRVPNSRRPPVYWWDKKINAARSECHRIRRQGQRVWKKYYKTTGGQEVVEARNKKINDAKLKAADTKEKIRINKR